MNATTHMTFGALSGGLLVAYAVSQHTMTLEFRSYTVYPVAAVAAAVVGGIAPDVDMVRSVSGRFMRNILRWCLAISAALMTLIVFSPTTHLPFADNLIRAGTAIDRKYPLMLAAVCIMLFFVIERSKHRGFTHTTAILLIISLPAVYMMIKQPVIPWANMVISAQIGFLLGWFSHLVADTFNYPGVSWLWPFVDNHFNIMRVDSGTSEENVFRVISILVFAVIYVAIAFPAFR